MVAFCFLNYIFVNPLSEAFQKLDDLLLFAHNQKDGDLSKILIIVIRKVENARLIQLKQINIAKLFK